MSDFLQELNESQRAAVLYNDGPALVIAGAGSGKTRVLTYKIAYLLEQGYQPWSILALTFTNKAAREMKERIARQVGQERARQLWMGTFHSLFLRILRTEAKRMGYASSFTIYDAADSKSLMRAIIKEMGLDDKVYKLGYIQNRISNAKNHLVTCQGYMGSKELYENDKALRMPALRDIYNRYTGRCRQADAMDFDDLLLNTYLLFKDYPEVLEHYRDQFRYVLVDEYQDTNYAQHNIVLQLAGEHHHVCVVGDDAQSIYSFRGADIDNILYFTKVFPSTKVFKLEENYRSTQTIVSAANSLIAKNERRIPKKVFSNKEKGDAIEVLQAYSDAEEGAIVANKIRELRRTEHLLYADFAILYRTNAQSRIFEETLRKQGVPYRIYGGLSFYQRKEVKDLIAYFRLVVNPNDEEAFKRIINYPARGIGDTTLGKIVDAATRSQVSLWTVLCAPEVYGLSVSGGVVRRLMDFRKLMESFMAQLAEKNAYELGLEILCRSGMIAEINRDNSPENLSRKENVEELMNGMKDFCTQRLEEGSGHVMLSDYLSEVALLTDQDADSDSGDDKVTLMTVHSAKGLEFTAVFVVGMEENLFPSSMTGDSHRALEEERRLFYVAITRAEKHCFLSYAKSRMRYGKTEFSSPSRFLRDIDTRYLLLPQDIIMGRKISQRADLFREDMEIGIGRDKVGSGFLSSGAGRPAFSSKSLQRLEEVVSASDSKIGDSRVPELNVGQLIEHERFGIGEVLRVDGEGDNKKAAIRFRNAGEKQLLLRFARFKVLS